MNMYRPPMYSANNIENLHYLYEHLEIEDPLYREYRFERIFEQVLREAYPKKDFQLINEWLNELKTSPDEWEYISAAHGITIETREKIAKYPSDYLIGGGYTNGKLSLEVAKNWLEVFSSRETFEVFASAIRAQFAHETHHKYQDQEASKKAADFANNYIEPYNADGELNKDYFNQHIEIDAYAAQVGQYCLEMGLTAGDSLKKLTKDSDRAMLSWEIKSKFNSDILYLYSKVITNFGVKKRFLRRIYDYIITQTSEK